METRRVGPVRAALLSFLGYGLGYVYVGRLRLALVIMAALFTIVALAAWSRLVFNPYSLYVVAAIALATGLLPVVHSAFIAARNREVPARTYNRWWIYLAWIVLSLIVSKVFTANRHAWFGFEPFRIPSAAMAPTVQKGDLVMADTWRYDRAPPQHGDIVVFLLPGNEDVKYLMRVVGLPGDRIELRNDVLVRNGEPVDEPYVRITGSDREMSRNFGPVSLPDGSYFVLGDNRHNARDSRYLGPIEERLLHGRIEHRWFAFDGGILWDRFPAALSRPESTNQTSE